MLPEFNQRIIFISGGSGYIGRRLIKTLISRGHTMIALVRKGSENKVPIGAGIAVGDALLTSGIRPYLDNADTFVQLIGTPHPAPWKKEQFEKIDLKAVEASLEAIKNTAISHYVYISVAQPAPAMKAYQRIRHKAEVLIKNSGVAVSFLRPWYVLGPRHRWPYILLPVYKLLELIPATRNAAERLGLVTINQMVATLVYAIEQPPQKLREYDVLEIKNDKE